jgi:hypothetical protein
MNQYIKYIFIGNIEKKVIIGTYPIKNDKNIKTHYIKAKGLFDSIILTKEKNENIQQKKEIDKEICYFTIKHLEIFYLIITPKSTSENIAFSFIDEVENCNIYLLINDKTNILNDIGKSELKKIFIEFNKNPLLSSNRYLNSKSDLIETEIRDTQDNIKTDTNNIVNNINNFNEIETQNAEIKSSTDIIKINNKKLKINKLWDNKKFKILFIGFIISIVIGLLIFISSDNKE